MKKRLPFEFQITISMVNLSRIEDGTEILIRSFFPRPNSYLLAMSLKTLVEFVDGMATAFIQTPYVYELIVIKVTSFN